MKPFRIVHAGSYAEVSRDDDRVRFRYLDAERREVEIELPLDTPVPYSNDFVNKWPV